MSINKWRQRLRPNRGGCSLIWESRGEAHEQLRDGIRRAWGDAGPPNRFSIRGKLWTLGDGITAVGYRENGVRKASPELDVLQPPDWFMVNGREFAITKLGLPCIPVLAAI